MFLRLVFWSAIHLFPPVLKAATVGPAIDEPSSLWQFQFGAQRYTVANDWTVDEADVIFSLTSASECERTLYFVILYIK